MVWLEEVQFLEVNPSFFFSRRMLKMQRKIQAPLAVEESHCEVPNVQQRLLRDTTPAELMARTNAVGAAAGGDPKKLGVDSTDFWETVLNIFVF